MLRMQDPLQADESMNKEREDLSDLASKTLTWLSEFLEKSLLFSCNEIFDAPLVQSITEELRRARADDCVLTWSLVKDLICKQLVDLARRVCLESLQTMRCSSGTHCIQWTSTSILLYGLIKETSKTVLGPVLGYNYWDGQVTTYEWKVLVADGLKQPTSDEEKEVFDYKEFQKVAKAAAPNAFPVFDKRTPEVAAYVATLLLPPWDDS